VARTIVHVNRKVIANNKKSGRRDPCITVKKGRTNVYASEVVIDGPCRIVYRPDKPLGCGATVFIETDSEVRYVGPITTPAVYASSCKLEASRGKA